MKFWLITLALILVSASSAQADQGLRGDLRAELVVDGLEFPVKMVSLSGKDLLVTEKMGNLRLIRDGELLNPPLARFDVKAQNEAGLLDVVLADDFADTGEFFVSYTPEEALDSIYVSRLRLEGDSATILDDPWIELPSEAATDRHFAGTMAFDDEGYFYVSIGDLRVPDYSQNLDHLAGSVLRYNRDGTIPDDNPFGNPIYAYGLRNPFGLAFDDDGNLLSVGNSDDVNDELNLITVGANYGWPYVEGRCDNFPEYEPCESVDEFVDPIFEFRTVNGPTGVVRYQSELIEAFDGDILVSGWHSGAIHHLSWTGTEDDRARKKGILYQARRPGAGLTDIEIGDDGAILVLESGVDHGAIYRIAPRDAIWNSEAVVGSDSGSGCQQAGSKFTTTNPFVWAVLVLLGFLFFTNSRNSLATTRRV